MTKTVNKILVQVLADFNTTFFENALSNEAVEGLQIRQGSMIPVEQQLAEMLKHSANSKPDLIIVWLLPEVHFPEILKMDESLWPSEKEVARSLSLLDALKKLTEMDVTVYLILPTWKRSMGSITHQKNSNGETLTCRLENLRQLMLRELSSVKGVNFLDPSQWLIPAGRKAFSSKLWFMAKIPFQSEVFDAAAKDICTLVRQAGGSKKKLLILDLDNTLWGGIVGEVGAENLSLGGHDPLGEAFIDFQTEIKRLKDNGLLLAIASKNDESVALQAIDQHPEMVLRSTDFVASRINWVDKSKNVEEILHELNLLAKDAVFFDDSAFERGRVKGSFPEMEVPELPSNPMEYTEALFQLPDLPFAAGSEEDKRRTEMYLENRDRNQLRESVPDIEEWLKDLELVVSVNLLDEKNLTRATQLLNKTNQWNLTTRRLNVDELSSWAKQENNYQFTFSVSDRFGDYGLVGLMGITMVCGAISVVDFVLSCRVLGREVEEVMLNKLVNLANRKHLDRVLFEFIDTGRNGPFKEFLVNSARVMRVDNHVFQLNMERVPSIAKVIDRVPTNI